MFDGPRWGAYGAVPGTQADFKEGRKGKEGEVKYRPICSLFSVESHSYWRQWKVWFRMFFLNDAVDCSCCFLRLVRWHLVSCARCGNAKISLADLLSRSWNVEVTVVSRRSKSWPWRDVSSCDRHRPTSESGWQVSCVAANTAYSVSSQCLTIEELCSSRSAEDMIKRLQV